MMEMKKEFWRGERTSKKLHNKFIDVKNVLQRAYKGLHRQKKVTLTNLGSWKYINSQILQLKQNHNK